ncbi:hypothetical protein, partial [Microbulbifer thermotolerans]|uniref:hypothetical protein n=1 Tax=Microbulbifer thermotolerans TaxID=252514 RepID=UPI002248A48D
MRDDYESHFVDHHDEITYHNKKTMKKMIQATLLAVFVPVMLLTGCDSSNGAADATAAPCVRIVVASTETKKARQGAVKRST